MVPLRAPFPSIGDVWHGHLEEHCALLHGIMVSGNLLAEKHGKDLVDPLFSRVGRWLLRALQTLGTVIKTVPEAVAALQAGGQYDMDHNPALDRQVVHFESTCKPAKC